MKHQGIALVLAALSLPAAADDLNDVQRHGRQLLAQNCGVCHLVLVRGTKTYGPPLTKAAASRNDDLARAFMPPPYTGISMWTCGRPSSRRFRSKLVSISGDFDLAEARFFPGTLPVCCSKPGISNLNRILSKPPPDAPCLYSR